MNPTDRRLSRRISAVKASRWEVPDPCPRSGRHASTPAYKHIRHAYHKAARQTAKLSLRANYWNQEDA